MKFRIRHNAEIETVTPAELRGMLTDTNRGEGYAGVYDLIVGQWQGPEPVLLTNPPVRRLRLTRKVNGQNNIAVPAGKATKICDQNEGRLAGIITNYGAAPCFIYPAQLSDIPDPNVFPGLWISSPGSWDFTLGEITWGGEVCAMGIGGATTVSVLEV